MAAIAVANSRLYQELHDSERRYHYLLTQLPGHRVADRPGRAVHVPERRLRARHGRAPGRSCWVATSPTVVHPDSGSSPRRPTGVSAWSRSRRSPTASILRDRDGLPVPSSCAPSRTCPTTATAGAHGIMRDLRDQVRLEDDLRRQAADLAQPRSAPRLAQELHDSVTQALFSMTLTTRSVELLMDRDPAAARQMLGELRELEREALAEMRALIFELRPANLEQDGLVQAIRTHAAGIQGRVGLLGPGRVRCPGRPGAAGGRDRALPHHPGGAPQRGQARRGHARRHPRWSARIRHRTAADGRGRRRRLRPRRSSRPATWASRACARGPARSARPSRSRARRARARASRSWCPSSDSPAWSADGPTGWLTARPRASTCRTSSDVDRDRSVRPMTHADPAPPHRGRVTGPSAPVRVLVVDSDRRVRQSLAGLIRISDGLDLCGCGGGSGRAPWSCWSTTATDVLLIDPRLPEAEMGLALLTELHRRWPSIAIVAMSGLDGVETVRHRQWCAGVRVQVGPAGAPRGHAATCGRAARDEASLGHQSGEGAHAGRMIRPTPPDPRRGQP